MLNRCFGSLLAAYLLVPLSLAETPHWDFFFDATNRAALIDTQPVRRRSEHLSANFNLILEGDRTIFPFAPFIRDEFLTKTLMAAKHVRSVRIRCLSGDPKVLDYFQVFAPTAQEQALGNAFQIEIGCEHPPLETIKKLRLLERLFKSMQPFASRQFDNLLREVPDGLSPQLRSLLLGEMQKPLDMPIEQWGIEWNAGESASPIPLVVIQARMRNVYQVCEVTSAGLSRDYNELIPCLSGSHYTGEVKAWGQGSVTQGTMRAGKQVGIWMDYGVMGGENIVGDFGEEGTREFVPRPKPDFCDCH